MRLFCFFDINKIKNFKPTCKTKKINKLTNANVTEKCHFNVKRCVR